MLCVGEMGDDPNAAWNNKIKWYSENNHFKELNRIDGMQTEFQWKIFPGFTTLGILEEIQKLMEGIRWEPEHFNDRIIFMSMYNDIAWGVNGNTEKCVQKSIHLAKYARRFPCGRWSFLGPGSEKKWYQTHSDKPDGNWDRTAEMMILQLNTESGHPVLRASSAFERGDLGSKGHGEKSTHFNENEGNIELLLRTVISVNQLSICRAVAGLRKELYKSSAEDSPEDSSEDSESLGTFDTEEGPHEMKHLCREYTMP